MKFSVEMQEPYLLTFEEKEFLKLTVNRLGPREVEVFGEEGAIQNWVLRTGAVELTEEELQARLASYVVPVVAEQEPAPEQQVPPPQEPAQQTQQPLIGEPITFPEGVEYPYAKSVCC